MSKAKFVDHQVRVEADGAIIVLEPIDALTPEHREIARATDPELVPKLLGQLAPEQMRADISAVYDQGLKATGTHAIVFPELYPDPDQ